VGRFAELFDLGWVGRAAVNPRMVKRMRRIPDNFLLAILVLWPAYAIRIGFVWPGLRAEAR